MKKINLGGRAFGVTVAALLAIGGLALTTGPAAQAAPAAKPAPAPEHCVMDLTRAGATACYTTFTEAIRVATGGRVADAPDDAVAAVRDSAFEAKLNAAAAKAVNLAAAQIVLSVEYDLINFGNPTLTAVGNNLCTASLADINYQAPDYNVTQPAWVNRITSFRTYANCRTKHWENPNFTGAVVGWSSTLSYIGGAMDNRTSSEQWS